METGDHPVKAKAIARKVNIIAENNRTKEQAAKHDYDWDAIVVSGT